MSHARDVRLGYEVGSGDVVSLPIRHFAITGQTQEAGKTTALEALITRSGVRALAFITKRGEGTFADARVIPPYFREQADWQFVASILEASRGEKLRFERAWIIRASKGAHTLADVQRNVQRQLVTAKGINADVYLTLDAYLEAVVPQIDRVEWARRIVLSPGVNVMDLTSLNVEMQHLVIRSSILWVLEHATDTVVVVPEAWKFIPQGRGTPVKLAAESFIRQAAGLRNYLWLDSQDIGGVEKTILRSVPVWLLGVQREANEIKRTLENIPGGVAKPKPKDIALLELGQFYACWGKHIRKTYVQPEWMTAMHAQQVATGDLTVDVAVKRSPVRTRAHAVDSPDTPDTDDTPKEATVKESEARDLRATNERPERENADMRRRLESLETRPARDIDVEVPRTTKRGDRPPDSGGNGTRAFSLEESLDNEQLYQAIKRRLITELPSDPVVMQIVLARPELRVEVERHVVTVDGSTLRGRIARLVADDFFSQSRTSGDVITELARRGYGGGRTANINVGSELKAFTEMGFFTRDNKWYTLVPDMKVNVVRR